MKLEILRIFKRHNKWFIQCTILIFFVRWHWHLDVCLKISSFISHFFSSNLVNFFQTLIKNRAIILIHSTSTTYILKTTALWRSFFFGQPLLYSNSYFHAKWPLYYPFSICIKLIFVFCSRRIKYCDSIQCNFSV